MNWEWAKGITYFLLRIVSGWLFFQHGAAKILGWFGGSPQPIETFSQFWIGGILELVGGLLILLGFFTRPTAFILSGEMAVAYWQFHAKKGGWPIENDGVAAVLYCFIFLLIAAHGAGQMSVDARLKLGKKR